MLTDWTLWLEWFIKSLFVIFALLTGFAYLTWYERRALARIQCPPLAAAEVFAQRGYARASVGAIAFTALSRWVLKEPRRRLPLTARTSNLSAAFMAAAKRPGSEPRPPVRPPR